MEIITIDVTRFVNETFVYFFTAEIPSSWNDYLV